MSDFYAAAGYPRSAAANRACGTPTGFGGTPLDELPLAMAYVPMQKYGAVYEDDRALCAGTLFPDLNKPFCGRGGVQ